MSLNSSERTPQPRRFTCEHCAGILSRLTSTLSRAGAPLSQNAEADLADVRWLASGSGSVFDERAMYGRDPERTIRGLIDAILMEKAAATLDIASTIPGFAGEARQLKHWRPRPQIRCEQQAVDCAYQFDIAAMARLAMPLPVTIAEPDLRIAEISVACKQPRSRNAVPEAIADGASQIRGQPGGGIVAVSLQNLVNPIVHGSHDDLRGAADDRALEFLRPQYPALANRLQRSPPQISGGNATGVLGVLFTTRYLHLDPEKGIRVALSVLPLENPTAGVPEVALLRFIAEGLIEGDAQLLRSQTAA